MEIKPYSQYKDSGVEWIGKIPKKWNIQPLKHIAKTIPGGTPSTNNLDYWKNGTIPWLPSGKVQNCVINENDVNKYITKKGLMNSATKYIGPNSILIALTGVTCGKIGFLTFKATANQSVISIEPYSFIPKYIYYNLLSQKEQILINKTGGAQSGINEDNVKNIKIAIPSFTEQEQIAKYLDKKTTKIEQTITKNKKLITLLKEKRTTLINQAVTKGLNPDIPMKESGIEWIGKIPKHWDIIPFKRVLNYIKDGTHGSFERVNEGEFLLSAKNVQNNKIIINENESIISENDYKSIVKNGFPKKRDLLVTIVGTLGRSCVYEFEKSYAFQRSVAFLRLKKHYNPYYYSYLIQTSFYQNELDSLSKQSAQKGVYLNDIWESIILNPSSQEQNQISEHLDKETKKIDKTIEKIEKNIELLEEYKESLIHHVVTGKIDVRGVEL